MSVQSVSVPLSGSGPAASPMSVQSVSVPLSGSGPAASPMSVQSISVPLSESDPAASPMSVQSVSTPKSTHGRSAPLKRKFLQDDCELNYAPNASDVLDHDELVYCCQMMKDIVRSEDVSRDESRLMELLRKTFANRRILINERATCSDVRQEYPGLFTKIGLLTDYTEMTHQRFTQCLMPSLRRNLSAVAASVMTLTERSAGSKTKVAKQFNNFFFTSKN